MIRNLSGESCNRSVRDFVIECYQESRITVQMVVEKRLGPDGKKAPSAAT